MLTKGGAKLMDFGLAKPTWRSGRVTGSGVRALFYRGGHT